MFQRNIRNKKGISPVISTIILIVVALVIALLVGVFAFGLFTSQTKSITLQSGNLYATGASLVFTLKNPASAPTGVAATTSILLNGPGETSANPTGCSAPAALTTTNVPTGTTQFVCAFAGTVTAGDTYDYVINLANGQSISGSVVGQ